MNRKEALHSTYRIFNAKDRGIARQLVKEIYDDFESRICKNCKYYEEYPSVCCNADSPLCAGVTKEDFGCNEFEIREDYKVGRIE